MVPLEVQFANLSAETLRNGLFLGSAHGLGSISEAEVTAKWPLEDSDWEH